MQARPWSYRDPLLLWLYPTTYILHLVEEIWVPPGFAAWARARLGADISAGWFLALNLVGVTLMIVGVRLVDRASRFGWIAVALASVVLLNAAAHAVWTIRTGTYSPGLLTGVVLWMPLGMLSLMRARGEVSRRSWWSGLGIGLAIHGLVMWAM